MALIRGKTPNAKKYNIGEKKTSKNITINYFCSWSLSKKIKYKQQNHIKYAVLRRGCAMACAGGAQTVDCSPSVGNAGGDDGDAAGDADGVATGEGASSVASDDADAEEGRENP